jgi:hypothetical protein
MLKHALLTALAAAATLAFAASAQAAYLTLGTSNTSNATTTLTGGTAGSEFLVRNTNGASASAYGLYGLLSATSPTVSTAAVRGQNSSTNGKGFGVYGSQAGSGTGVVGSSPSGRGVWGNTANGIGVLGNHAGTSASDSPGVQGQSAAGNGTGVEGIATNSSLAKGVRGVSDSGYGGYFVAPGQGGYGVYSFGSDVGVFASSSQSGTGVSAASTGGTAVSGTSSTGYAGYFTGKVAITGGCTGCTGPSVLQIDDPLDPAHKYLNHSSVASSQQLDVYSGNVTTNAKGFAIVTMPRWFQALNRSFRYQLTIVGSRGWNARVVKPMANNRFTIQSDRSHVQVSWEVSAVRHDRYAEAHSTRVIVSKPKADQGKYVHPELYGKPRSAAIGYRQPPFPKR